MAVRAANRPHTQAFRRIAENLLGSLEPGARPTWLVTSAVRGEGVTTTLLGLARALAERRVSVAAVDANLIDPQLHLAGGVEPTPGLGELLAGQAPLETILRPWPAAEGVTLAPAGDVAAGGTQWYQGPAWRDCVAALKQRFDVVLLDAPALDESREALRAAAAVDGVLLVVRAGKTPADAARRARDVLAEAGGKVLGVVLNRFRDYSYGWLKPPR